MTVTKGLPPTMKKVKGRKRKRKGFGRTMDESRVVQVNHWPMVDKGLGVLSYYVSSSNICRNCCTDRSRWPGHVITSVQDRLAMKDGLAKGRVLFAFGRDHRNRVSPVAVLRYHVQGAGIVEILGVDVANDCQDLSGRLITGLLLCAQNVARVSGDGQRSELQWSGKSADKARDYIRRYGFRQVTKDRNGYRLRRRM